MKENIMFNFSHVMKIMYAVSILCIIINVIEQVEIKKSAILIF